MSRHQNGKKILLPSPKREDGKGPHFHGSIKIEGNRYDLTAFHGKSRWGGPLLVLTARPMKASEDEPQ
jgi:hypothetical protein